MTNRDMLIAAALSAICSELGRQLIMTEISDESAIESTRQEMIDEANVLLNQINAFSHRPQGISPTQASDKE
jgi:hypothetical protein